MHRKFESIFIKQLSCGFNGPILHSKCSRSFPIYDRMQLLLLRPPPLLIYFMRGAFHVPMSNKFKYLKQNEYLNFQIPFWVVSFVIPNCKLFLCSMCARARVCDFVADNNYVIFVIYHRFAPNCNSNWSITRMIKHFSYLPLIWSVNGLLFFLFCFIEHLKEVYTKARPMVAIKKKHIHLGYWWLPFSSFHLRCWRSKVKLFLFSFSFWSFQMVKFTIDKFSLKPRSPFGQTNDSSRAHTAQFHYRFGWSLFHFFLQSIGRPTNRNDFHFADNLLLKSRWSDDRDGRNHINHTRTRKLGRSRRGRRKIANKKKYQKRGKNHKIHFKLGKETSFISAYLFSAPDIW